MKPIGYLTTKDKEWKVLPHNVDLSSVGSSLIYTAESDGSYSERVSDNWQHIGYIFPDDKGGTIFPNKLTGGKNAVAAYVKREAPPVAARDPRDVRIAELEELCEALRLTILDEFATAALSALVQNPNVKGMVHDVGRLAYEVADVMLHERIRRQSVKRSDAAPEADQE